SLPGRSDGRRPVERKSGGVREQVAHRRAGRAGGLVELEETLLRRDENGNRRRRLRDRGPAEGALEVAARCLDAAGDGDRSVGAVHGHLCTLRAYVAEIARKEGCRFASAGTHPFSLFERQRITAKDRYRQLVDQLQYIARSELIFGMHVHAAVDGPERAIKIMNALAAHLPQLLALCAS